MRFGAKALITAALAGPAMAALILTVAGPANAAVTTAHTPSNSGPFYEYCNQYPNQYGQNQFKNQYGQNQFKNQYGQNQFKNQYGQNQWNLSGSTTIKVKFEVNTYDYPVYFTQQGSCLTGTFTDPGASFTGRIHGTVYGNFVTFSVTYPAGSKQGTRTFNGTINQWGYVSGSWSETGTEDASGSWSLSRPASGGCQPNYQWNQHQGCYYQPHQQP